MHLIWFNSPRKIGNHATKSKQKRNRTIMYERKQQISIKNKKQIKEKHKQQKKRNNIKTANCIYQINVKKPQDKRSWRCPAIFWSTWPSGWWTWNIGVTKSELNRAPTGHKQKVHRSRDSIPRDSLEPRAWPRLNKEKVLSKRKKRFSKLIRP